MESLFALVATFMFATLRYLPVIVLPTLSPMTWAPGMVRLLVLLSLAWMTTLAAPSVALEPHWRQPMGLALAAAAELLVGLTFGLAIAIPNAALHSAGWLVDMQAGLGAANLFNPGNAGEMESLLGHAIGLATIVLFFSLDLHHVLLRALVESLQVMPLGAIDIRLDPSGLFGLLGSAFLLGLMVVVPVVLGLFCVDLAVAYATRSMPQANVYFLALPLKVAAGIFLLALSLRYAPELVGRLFRDALYRIPSLFGA